MLSPPLAYQITHDVAAYYPSLAQAMFAALLHFDPGVRETGWTLVRQLLEAAPCVLAELNTERLLQEVARRLPGEVAAGSTSRGARLMRTMELLVQVSFCSSFYKAFILCTGCARRITRRD